MTRPASGRRRLAARADSSSGHGREPPHARRCAQREVAPAEGLHTYIGEPLGRRPLAARPSEGALRTSRAADGSGASDRVPSGMIRASDLPATFDGRPRAALLRALCGVALLAGCRARPPQAEVIGEAPPTAVSAPLPAAAAVSAPLPSAAPASRPPLPAPTRATLALRSAVYDGSEAGIRADCALTPSGEVQCWSASAPPVVVPGLRGVDSLVATGHFTCARTAAGAVRCWGLDPTATDEARPGPFESSPSGDRPARIRGLPDDVDAISAGAEALCARRRGGGLRCVGERDAAWVAPHAARARVQGGGVDCWLGADGAASCTWTREDDPVERATRPGPYTSLALTGWGIHGTACNELCVIDGSSAVRCFHGLDARNQGKPISLPRPVVQIAAGVHLTCALVDDGSVHCWDGAIGLRHDVPFQVQGMAERAVEIAVGDGHACARLESSEVVCFGSGYDAKGWAAPASWASARRLEPLRGPPSAPPRPGDAGR